MSHPMFSNLKFAVFKFRCRAADVLNLPAYKGSTLRGGFGVTFRRVVCVTKLPVCQPCILRYKCSYSYVFETPYLAAADDARDASGPAQRAGQATFEPHPFVIEPPLEDKETYQPGDELNFDLILVGKAIDYLPYFIFTFEEMGRSGIGRGRGRYRLEKVLCIADANDTSREQPVLYDGQTRLFYNRCLVRNFKDHVLNEARAIRESPLLRSADNRASAQITLRFLTPTRIKYKDRLTSDIDFEIVMRNLLRRLSLLSEVHCDEKLNLDYRKLISDARDSVRTVSSNLRWYDWERYSQRQQTRLKMGGFRGEITFEGRLEDFLPFLVLGKYLHIGKGTAYGLGKYEIV